MTESFLRTIDGEEQRLCWRFQVHGQTGTVYEPANGSVGPLDPDRRRRLRRGETFLRLNSSGSPREYQGLCWIATASMAAPIAS